MPRIIKDWGGGAADVQATAVLISEHAAMVAEIAALVAMVNDLKAKFNAHTHVENVAAAYTQNASVNAVVAGQQEALANVVQTSSAITYD